MFDVVVVGAGPAGLAVAAQCAGLGLEVLCLAPQPSAPWPNNYGAWLDELDAAGYADAVAFSWPRARVRLGDAGGACFDRTYVRIDNARLRARLEVEGQDRLRFMDAEAQVVHHRQRYSTLELADGRRVEGRVIVDATGRGALLEPEPALAAAEVAAQVAFGVELEGPHGLPPEEMLFMDFSPLEDDARPTFLYAMPFGPDRVFVEETVLVDRPAPPMAELERRLGLRLRGLGLDGLTRRGEAERCFIPMGRALPRGPQRVVPFGASAGMVHPATGYLLTRALLEARPLAQALAQGLRHAPEQPRLAAELGWGAVWPAARRRRWEVFRFGMEVLIGLDAPGTRAFFRAFFDLDPEVWARYLSGVGDGLDVARVMSEVFARLPWRLRARLVRESLGRPGLDLLRALA